MTPPPVVLVTGSSTGGIGASLSEAFAARGCIVYATARRLDSLQRLEHSIQGVTGDDSSKPVAGTGVVKKFRLDVTSEDSVQEAVKEIITAEGRIDILVNNAGIHCIGPVLDVSTKEAEAAFQTNVISVMRMQSAIVPHMATQRSGLVINIGSITAIAPIPFAGVYAATKAALRSITETLYLECKPFNVDVMLIEAGGVRSNLSQNAAPRYNIPEKSLYKSYLSKIIGRMHASQSPGAMDTDEFARAVVSKALPKREVYTLAAVTPLNNDPGAAAGITTNPTAVVFPKRYGTPARYLSIGSSALSFWIMSWLPRGFFLNLLWKKAQAFRPPPGVEVPEL
ncbi:NAD-binding protein [Cantharellus anzutake]|uniref:NAD-binding protein n=1 Tax=Cantharellus anzutake TaxID=1750568 RepID=UPI001906E91C|nr:NAD-binding protein [Cantharellus anzutake]KAF8330369.1 NAD-binding protein [Cantharellus anzutake]